MSWQVCVLMSYLSNNDIELDSAIGYV